MIHRTDHRKGKSAITLFPEWIFANLFLKTRVYLGKNELATTVLFVWGLTEIIGCYNCYNLLFGTGLSVHHAVKWTVC